MATINTETSFSISVKGETTGDDYKGNFSVKTRLSHRDQLNRDRIRRDLLGEDAASASPRAHTQAEVFSQLAVRVTKSPSWWSDNANGLDLMDDAPVKAVYDAALKAEQEALDVLKSQAEDAKESLGS